MASARPDRANEPALTPAEERSRSAVLIVDDNDVNLMVMEAMIEKAGYTPIVARSGPEGIALALASRPQLVLMDIQMPGMTGIEAVNELRRVDPIFRAPIIAVTAGISDQQRAACEEAGFSEIILKPIDFQHLRATLTQLIA